MDEAIDELKRRVREYYAIALELMGEEAARDFFCSVTKRGRGMRGRGLNRNPRPSKDAERKWRERNPPIDWRIIGSLTEEDLRDIDHYFIHRMNRIADKK